MVRDVQIEMVVSGKSRLAIDAQGYDDAPIYDVALRDCEFRNVAEPNVVKNVRGLTLHHVTINGKGVI